MHELSVNREVGELRADEIVLSSWHDNLGEALEFNELCVPSSFAGDPIEHTIVVLATPSNGPP